MRKNKWTNYEHVERFIARLKRQIKKLKKEKKEK
jgi:hypothetical protein